MRRDVIDDGGDGLAIGDIERPGLCRSAARRNLLCDRLRALFREIRDRDIGALRAEHKRGGTAHAAGRAGDENGQSLHRPAKLLEIRHQVALCK